MFLCSVKHETGSQILKSTIMKKYIATLMLSFCSILAANAMSYEMAREHALYLTDKMAYELNLNDEQYNYCYEINLDYLMNVNTANDVYGPWLTYRNADIRNILYDWQYALFIAADYFFRPVSWLHGAWYYPIYRHYAPTHFFYTRPRVFFEYRGGHSRLHFRNSFYVNRPHWNGGFRGMERGRIEHRLNSSIHVGRNGVGRTQFGAANHNRGLNDSRTRSITGSRAGVEGRGASRPMNENRVGASVNRTGAGDTYRFGASNNGHVTSASRSGNNSPVVNHERATATNSSRFGNSSRSVSSNYNYDRPSSTRNVTSSGINRPSTSISGASRSVTRGSSSAFGGGSSRSSIGTGMSSRSGSMGAPSSRSMSPSASRSSSFSGGSRGGGFSGGGSRGGSSRGGGRGGR